MSPEFGFSSAHATPDHRLGDYPSGEILVERFRQAVAQAGGRETVAGSSVEGRLLPRFDLGTPGRPAILLTALMHGVEAIGALALLDVVQRLGRTEPARESLLRHAHIVILPLVNPDAYFANMQRIAAGRRAWQRCNANGVDLNRNFPRQTTKKLRHPFSGSRFKLSPHYLGPHSLSEPESRAVRALAVEVRPKLSLAFHSFGNLLLYPWAHTATENPRVAEYRALGASMSRALVHTPYRLQQARQLYSVLGDMDDWLDAEVGTLAFTVEVSRPTFTLHNARHLTNPFFWMNPLDAAATVANLTPGVMALMSSALGLEESAARRESPGVGPQTHISLAAK